MTVSFFFFLILFYDQILLWKKNKIFWNLIHFPQIFFFRWGNDNRVKFPFWRLCSKVFIIFFFFLTSIYYFSMLHNISSFSTPLHENVLDFHIFSTCVTNNCFQAINFLHLYDFLNYTFVVYFISLIYEFKYRKGFTLTIIRIYLYLKGK